MKNLISTALIFFTLFSSTNAQSLNGAWKTSEGNIQHQIFFQDDFFFHTIHQDNQFIMTRGGKVEIKDNLLHVLLLFNSADTSEVNKKIFISYSLTSNSLSLKHPEENIKLERLDDGKAPLAGVWQITGRLGEDGEIKPIHQTGTRHTYKLPIEIFCL